MALYVVALANIIWALLDKSGCYYLPKMVGLGRALEFACTCDFLSTGRAQVKPVEPLSVLG
jgi:hypothetical protein